MNQSERLIFLIRELLSENERYSQMQIPRSWDEQWQLFRALCNIRPPWPARGEFLREQDAFLAVELTRRGGAVSLNETTCMQEGLYLWQGDITRLAVDGIVNAANSRMLGCWIPGHHCIDNAIHTYAGIQLRLECDRIMKEQGFDEPTGQAKVTPAYNLPARYVIHTVGPMTPDRHPTYRDCEALTSSYHSCLKAADEYGMESIAFCCISTGEFSFPQDLAASIALDAVRAYREETHTSLKVVFNVFKDYDKSIYESLFASC